MSYLYLIENTSFGRMHIIKANIGCYMPCATEDAVAGGAVRPASRSKDLYGA